MMVAEMLERNLGAMLQVAALGMVVVAVVIFVVWQLGSRDD